MTELLVAFLVSMIAAATPLLLAATGELVVEKAGVLNLGVEGMMLAGAIAAFATTNETGMTTLGVLAALLAGMALALLFAVISLTLQANQTATGLALTIFGRGFSALLGAGYVGIPAPTLPKLYIPVLSDIPVIGPVLFQQDFLVYLSLVMLAIVAFILKKTHLGLIIRAVGDSHDAAHSLGYAVLPIRYCAVMFGGALAGRFVAPVLHECYGGSVVMCTLLKLLGRRTRTMFGCTSIPARRRQRAGLRHAFGSA